MKDPETISISAQFGSDLYDTIQDLMRIYAASSSEADYVCAFCHERPETNMKEIHHKPGCDGTRFMKGLNDAYQRAKGE